MSRTRVLSLILLVLLAVPLAVAAQQQAPGQPTIDQLRAPRGPFDPRIPTPESVLGFYPGADFQLADWPSILSYLRELDASSDRMQLVEIGRSSEGQPLVLALISSAANLAAADDYRSIAERLARAEGVDEAEARELAHRGKAIVWIDSGLHATEVAHGQHAPELAYVMVAGESEELRRIRDDVILLLMPNMNPDGLNIVVDWYRQNLGTPYETAPLPVLYQKYVGHDNNRDWYMVTQPETRAVTEQLYHRWYPQIVYNHHQSAPFPARIFVPPFDDPANPNIPPLVLRGIARVGTAITTRLESEGKSGAVSRLGFTAWWNGGMRTAPYFHNMVGILTETALFRYATPNFYPPDDLPDTFRDGTSTREPSMKYPMPWPGGWWRLRDPIEYMLTASLATVDVGSRYREDWLMNIWRMGDRAIRDGRAGSPAAWVLPLEQRDPSAAAELVNVLRRGGVDVEQADEAFTADGRDYPPGTWVVPAAQAFRSYAVDLLEPQRYPDRRLFPGGPAAPPYDMAGWTLPFQMGVDVQRIEEPFDASLERLDAPVAPEGRIVGDGNTYLLDPRDNATATAMNRLLDAGVEIFRLAAPTRVDGETLPAGAVVVEDAPGLSGRMAAIAEEEGVVVRATGQRPRGNAWALREPRIGLYEPWVASIDAGWTRFVLDKYDFTYRTIRDADLRKGDLAAMLDVLILPSMRAGRLLHGNDPATMPARYSGGMGEAGVEAIRRFVQEDGGTLVALDLAGELAMQRLGLPLVNPLEGLGRDEFYCPGSLLRIRLDPSQPIAYGMPVDGTAFFVDSVAYEVGEGAPEGLSVVASYPDDGPLLESGWILGEEHLRGRDAVLDVPSGHGHVVLLGFRTQFRAQPYESFKLLFNSLFQAGASPTTLR